MGERNVPRLTPEQKALREKAMERPPGPPLPEGKGPSLAPKAVPETEPDRPGKALAPMDGPPGAPNDFRYFRTSQQAPYSTGTSTISETHAGTAGPVVFYAGNWFASHSTDDGATWTFVNPYNQFTSLDGGFCCDQTVIYDRTRDVIIWQLQYSFSATTQRGSWRTAFARANSVASGGWCTYDWNPGSFGLGANLWLDYPSVAVSDNFVWYTLNVYNNANAWQRTLIFRIPLQEASNCQGFTYNFFVVSDRFNFTPTQGATTTMYWASHTSTSEMRVYRWAENSGTIFWDDRTISTWPRNLPMQCPGPDGLNWCGRGPNDGRIQTAWVAGGVIGFMWNASQQGTTRPFPYVHVTRFRESDRALLSEPIIWHTGHAWAFPAVGVNARGHLGGSIFWGGGTANPNNNIFIVDDVSGGPPPWENYFLAGSAQGATSWGDWYSGRRHGRYGNTWTATGQARTSTGAVNSTYAWFGRERDTPPSMIVSPGTSISAAGFQGGPFSPNSFSYQISATACCVDYQITNVPTNWLTASSTTGTVGTSPVTVTFSVNGNAATLPPGFYGSTIRFRNARSSLGSTTRNASLTVNVRPVLSVRPLAKQTVVGPVGGPFDPNPVVYRLNTSQGTANWSVSGIPDWVTIKPDTTGSVGTEVLRLRVSINNRGAKLPRGRYRADLVFSNLTDPSQGPLERTIQLEVGIAGSSKVSMEGKE